MIKCESCILFLLMYGYNRLIVNYTLFSSFDW